MDDWSLLPSRNVSDPAPNPQSTMTTTEDVLSDSPGRVKRPQPAPITRARKTRRLTRPASPDNKATKSGASPETPAKAAKPIMTLSKLSTNPSANFKNGQPSLDITRPFMDDIGETSAEIEQRIDGLLAGMTVGEDPQRTLSELARLGVRRLEVPGSAPPRSRPPAGTLTTRRLRLSCGPAGCSPAPPGFRCWASTRPVSRPSRQPATGIAGDYSDRTHTCWRRRAYVGSGQLNQPPPTLDAQSRKSRTKRVSGQTGSGGMRGLAVWLRDQPVSWSCLPLAGTRGRAKWTGAAEPLGRLSVPRRGRDLPVGAQSPPAARQPLPEALGWEVIQAVAALDSLSCSAFSRSGACATRHFPSGLGQGDRVASSRILVRGPSRSRVCARRSDCRLRDRARLGLDNRRRPAPGCAGTRRTRRRRASPSARPARADRGRRSPWVSSLTSA
jgi:hypothetical protein